MNFYYNLKFQRHTNASNPKFLKHLNKSSHANIFIIGRQFFRDKKFFIDVKTVLINEWFLLIGV